ncbi:CVNH domain-containing protein [Nostoc sp.]|uniref:mannose-binding lectin n=1 Tax=Nostoc sp. TaxID=1180 RepID=UPI002FFCF35E
MGKFTLTSSNITLEGSVLKAVSKTTAQKDVQTSIDLNDCIANIDGTLTWTKGGNFKATSRNIKVESSSGNTILRAESQKANGSSWVDASLNLDEKITNNEGTLRYDG